MDLVCNNCSQPNPPGSRLCSRCSSVFPVLSSETLIEPGAKPAGVSTGTLLDTAGSGTMIPPGGGSGTMVSPAVALGTMVDPSEAGSGLPAVAPARAPSRGGSRPRTDPNAFAAGTVEPGARLGSRYEIVKLLGKGGMGAVYLARDLDLGRDVALKLIAPHLANESAVLERFKREIQLSSIVTHQNVLRVYDLGDADGIKFLTMQFIEGETLADLLAREKPVPLDRLLPIFRQICDGLAAAHDKAVLHRDLKPQNVMLDAEGHVYLMDFGLATSRTMTAMTQAGAVMGTPQYMSPEQVKGTATDARTDIFSLGVMLYEMLSGELPFGGDSLFEIMVKRTLGPPRPIGEVNPSVPPYLQQMVERCLAIDPAQRYATMAELLSDLDAGTVKAPIKKRRGPSKGALVVTGALLVALVLGVGGTMLASRITTKPTGPPKAVTVLVGDFENRTGENVFTGTFEPALLVALEGASFVTSYSRGSALKVADQLKLEGSGLPEKRARLVAQREGVAVVTSGFVEKEGSGYRVGVRAVDAFTGQRLMEEATDVDDKAKALGGVTKLAARLRNTLGDATPVGVQLKEAETYGAASLEAAHEYAVGAALASAGKPEEAKAHYFDALKLDPDMSRALAGLGAVEANQGRRTQAQEYIQQAIARVGKMSEREKFRTVGVYHLISRDADKAIETYTALLKQFPSDNIALVNLSYAFAMKHDFRNSLEMLKKGMLITPNDVRLRNNVGFVTMFVGEFAGAVEEQRKVVQAFPNFANGYVGLALAQLAAGQPDAAVETWKNLAQLGAIGRSLSAEGLADLALYQGRLADAKAILVPAISEDVAGKDNDAAARKSIFLARVSLAYAQPKPAVAAAERALKLTHEEATIFQAAQILVEAGRESRALTLADELEKTVASEARMYAELVRGDVELKRGSFAEAIAHYKVAIQRLDAWIARFALGRAYVEAGAYPSALDDLERCDKRKGEATDAFQATLPTFHLYPPAKYYLARTYEAVKSPAALEAYKAFLAARTSDEDLLVLDARERVERLQRAAAAPAASAK